MLYIAQQPQWKVALDFRLDKVMMELYNVVAGMDMYELNSICQYIFNVDFFYWFVNAIIFKNFVLFSSFFVRAACHCKYFV
jgi:hypothetical protein